MSVEAAFARVAVGDESFHACTESQVVAAVQEALRHGTGGRIITPNVDILRQSRRDPIVRGYLADATFVVADGMPLVWASRLAGTPLPERVCGASLIWSLAAGLGRDGRSVYVLGGEPAQSAAPAPPAQSYQQAGRRLPSPQRDPRTTESLRSVSSAPGVERAGQVTAQTDTTGAGDASSALGASGAPTPVGSADGAWRATVRLVTASPGLRVAGWHSPTYGFERDPDTLARVCHGVVRTKPDLVFVGLGFPKQEWLISRLRGELPSSWFLGCGAAVNFVAGDHRRAPEWMQRAGLEWAHRLVAEPRRMAGRYIRHDAPHAVRLLAAACAARMARSRRRKPIGGDANRPV